MRCRSSLALASAPQAIGMRNDWMPQRWLFQIMRSDVGKGVELLVAGIGQSLVPG
jgi:hypothetical protein